MTFTKSDNHDFIQSQDYSPGLNRYPVPGSHPSVFQDTAGQIFLQELDSPSCQVKHTVFQMSKKLDIRIQDKVPLLQICIALQNDQQLEIEGLGAVHIREGQFNLMYVPVYDQQIKLEVGKEYICLNLNYQSFALQEMAPYFEGLANFLDKVRSGRPAILQPEHSWVTREIQDTIYRMLHCPVDIPSYPVFFDLLMKTLLFLLLLQSIQQQPPSTFSHYEVDGIYAARDIIRKNIRYHFIISEIAQRVGMNEAKLKIGFREIFGNGVYEYLQTERMMEARHLLFEQGRSIKEIAALTGYKSVNSFIKAFKKKYRLTPGEFRKRA
jgi:AraC-like DNA-binding protein